MSSFSKLQVRTNLTYCTLEGRAAHLLKHCDAKDNGMHCSLTLDHNNIHFFKGKGEIKNLNAEHNTKFKQSKRDVR